MDQPEFEPKTLVRIGDLSGQLGVGMKTLRRLADQGRIPSTRTAGGHRYFDVEEVRIALASSLPGATIAPTSGPNWDQPFPLNGLKEHEVWEWVASDLRIDSLTDGGRIAQYAFTEMLNNAIDHSSGRRATVSVWVSGQEIAFRIGDDGVGAFARLRDGLGLDHALDAAAELTKGKRTTWRERHTGEGIFFTSKAVTAFRISANGFRLTIDNERADVGLGISPVQTGTVVESSIALPSPHTLRSVFAAFTNDDHRFSRSRPTVKLFGVGVSFVSRSEARRVMDGMIGFDDIDIDFAGVEDVGQGFVDEALRVWPAQHPGVNVHPINMNEAVEFMVLRARAEPS